MRRPFDRSPEGRKALARKLVAGDSWFDCVVIPAHAAMSGPITVALTYIAY